jgi:hypothetical protein
MLPIVRLPVQQEVGKEEKREGWEGDEGMKRRERNELMDRRALQSNLQIIAYV